MVVIVSAGFAIAMMYAPMEDQGAIAALGLIVPAFFAIAMPDAAIEK